MARKFFLSNNPQVTSDNLYTNGDVWQGVLQNCTGKINHNPSITNNAGALILSILGLLALYTHFPSDLGTLQTHGKSNPVWKNRVYHTKITWWEEGQNVGRK